MSNQIPKSLIEAASRVLMSEALASTSHRKMATTASDKSRDASNLTAAERISQHVIPLGQDHVVIPLERAPAEPHPLVSDHLDLVGYRVHDYEKGLALKKGEDKNPINIGKVLERTNAPKEVKTAFQKDPSRQGQSASASIVITRHPHDVAAMSTHQNWESCQSLGGTARWKENGVEQESVQKKGEYCNFVPEDIRAGTHVAYLVHHPDDVKKHRKPIARIALKPFISTDDAHTILRPMEVYGDDWSGFHHTVSKWSDKHFPTLKPEYLLHSDVYNDGIDNIRDYGEKHDDYWANEDHQDSKLAQHTKSHRVIDSLIENNQYNAHMINSLAKNPNISEEHSNKILGLPLKNNYAIKNNLFSHTKHAGIIDHAIGENERMADVYSPFISSNENASAEHLSKLLPMALKHENVSTLTNIMEHPNSTQEHVNQVSTFEGASSYPKLAAHIVRRGTDEAANKVIKRIDQDDYMYHSKTYANVAAHKPHLLPLLSNIELLHAYRGATRNTPSKEALETEILSRDIPILHKQVTLNSDNRKTLEKLYNHPSPEVATGARNRVANVLDAQY